MNLLKKRIKKVVIMLPLKYRDNSKYYIFFLFKQLHNYISYRDIVGNSSSDIWLGSLERGLWHFSGENWELTEFPGSMPSALWLFEDNTLWVGTG